MSIEQTARAARLALALGALLLPVGCGGGEKAEYIPQSEATKQKTADMQKAMMNNMKGTMGGQAAKGAPR